MVDKKLKLPGGTSYQGYTIFKAYKNAADATKAAQDAAIFANATVNVSSSASTVINNLNSAIKSGVPLTTADLQALEYAEKAKAGADAAKDVAVADKTSKELAAKKANANFKASAITITVEILLSAFSEQLAAIDNDIGVPPGTISSTISTGTAWYVTNAFNLNPAGLYISAAFLVYNLIFGFSKQEYQVTCPQYTLDSAMNGFYSGNGSMHPMAYVNYDMYCKEDDNKYMQWAQINTRNLLYELLIMGEATHDSNLKPTLLGTFRKEDVDFLNGTTNGKNLVQRIFGPNGFMRGIKGLYQSEYMSDFVHVGY